MDKEARRLQVTMNGVGSLATWSADEKVIWLNVAVYKVLHMDRFYS
jgi:hypothetical protein